MKHLCLIHGWGVNSAIFTGFQTAFTADWQVSTPDLIGHGASPNVTEFDIATAADAIAQRLPEKAFVLGWSLGSLVALHLAQRHPEKVRALILMSGMAKLRAETDYPEGVDNKLLNKMVDFFQYDYAKHVRQFLALQLIHTPEQQGVMNAVLPDLLKHGSPQALTLALNALEHADARAMLPEIGQPVLIVCGNKDAVTPPRMSEYLARHLPNARLQLIDKAAHAPFLSHPQECVHWIETFAAAI
ncbi:pimeloyl-ACP methyl ester esterase BioH [Alysiella sp.]|uniref:pimeloyl-ACP methyl ester esterase BioH n=1 Tax=Alysiella sp. TaxID=1872483 RepID=UPI0026DCC266|nr:pimeloyl-ACP methyl ester esterase BioH [Alysiella sp.]